MTALAAGQFELGGLVFGPGCPVEVEEFVPGSTSTRDQDVDDAFADVRHFGRDQKTPATWTWELGVNQRSEADALDTLADLESVWDAEDVRDTVGAVVPLRYRVAGRTRRVYGRPRRFTPGTEGLSQGYLPVTATFDRVDGLHYDDVEQSVPLTMGATPSGAYTAPFRTPLRASGGGERVNELTVGGTAATWATVTFQTTAFVVNPWVEIAGWRIELTTALPYDQPITVDPRPWVRSVYRRDGTHLGRYLTARSRLARMRLPAGRTHAARIGCASSTGAFTATVRWRNASKTL